MVLATQLCRTYITCNTSKPGKPFSTFPVNVKGVKPFAWYAKATKPLAKTIIAFLAVHTIHRNFLETFCTLVAGES
jgi:hypothetical protein